jgi:hypothetical protein
VLLVFYFCFTRFVHGFEKEKNRMKSKLIFGLLAMTLILAFASASFAQINLQIFSSPTASESLNKRTAQTADPLSTGGGVTVSGGVIANAELTTTIITLTYGAPITSSCGIAAASCPGNATQAAVPAADSIRIVAATGLFAGVTINTVRYSAGTIDLVLPECKQVAENGVANCVAQQRRQQLHPDQIQRYHCQRLECAVRSSWSRYEYCNCLHEWDAGSELRHQYCGMRYGQAHRRLCFRVASDRTAG